MVVLDTDHMSLLEWGDSGHSAHLRNRLSALAAEEIVTTIINYEEQMRGWTSYVAKARTVTQQVEAYRRLKRHLDNYLTIPVIEFDEVAAIEYQRLRKLRLGIGTMDLKIAAIVLSQNGTLLSRNLKDFRNVPDLVVADWTA